MDIQDTLNSEELKAEAEKLAANPLASSIMGVVGNLAHEKVGEVELMAKEKGLGGVMNMVVNMAEEKTGVDIDGDGDIGK